MSALDVALAAAAAGAAAILGRRPAQVGHKGRSDLVTEVDLASEAAILAVLARETPGTPVVAEEGGGDHDAPTRWVVDPLDGTTNFVHGVPWYAVVVGLVEQGEPTVGVVWEVELGRIYAADGRGAFTWRHDRPTERRRLRVSDRAEASEALVATGFSADHHARSAFYARRVEVALREARCVRRLGSAALDLALVADGVFDVYFESALHPWDVLAGEVLVRQAGGIVTDVRGAPLRSRRPEPLAANPHLHPVALGWLREADG